MSEIPIRCVDRTAYNKVSDYREDLEILSVASTTDLNGNVYASLRVHVRRAVEAGDIKGVTGVQIAALKKDECIALLCGDSVPMAELPPPEISGAAYAAPEKKAVTGSAPKVPDNAADSVAQALAVLTSAFGGQVKDEDIRKQVAALTEPYLRQMAETSGAMKEWMGKAEQQNEQLRAELRAGKPVRIEVVQKDGEVRDCGRQHFLFPLVLAVLSARCHPYLAGPAGSFKTSTAHAAANALGLKFYAISVCAQTTKTDLLGFFVPGTGEYMPTDFRRAFENGGVFTVDEVDAGNANVLAVLNAALANSQMAFPDGMIERHKDFVLIACGNTYGQGADRLYVGRNQLDAATLDRFCFIDFPYDTGLEAEYCGIAGQPSPAFVLEKGGIVTATDWMEYVHKVRKIAETQKVRAVFSTRASIYGVKLASHGVGRAHLEAMLIWKGLDAATAQKIKAGL